MPRNVETQCWIAKTVWQRIPAMVFIEIFTVICTASLYPLDEIFQSCLAPIWCLSCTHTCRDVAETLRRGYGEVRQIPTTGWFRRQAGTCEALAGRDRGETELSGDCKHWTWWYTEPTRSMHGNHSRQINRSLSYHVLLLKPSIYIFVFFVFLYFFFSVLWCLFRLYFTLGYPACKKSRSNNFEKFAFRELGLTWNNYGKLAY